MSTPHIPSTLQFTCKSSFVSQEQPIVWGGGADSTPNYCLISLLLSQVRIMSNVGYSHLSISTFTRGATGVLLVESAHSPVHTPHDYLSTATSTSLCIVREYNVLYVLHTLCFTSKLCNLPTQHYIIWRPLHNMATGKANGDEVIH